MMKKVLLGTTAMFGASVLMAGAAMASDPPKVVLSGYIKVEAWFLSQDQDKLTATTNQSRGVAISLDDAEFHLNAKATADNGLEYGAHMEIKVDKNTTTDEASVWFQGPWGWAEAGRNDGAEDVVKVYGANVMGGDGVWDGSAIYSTPQGWTSGSIHAPTSIGDTGDANKVTYFTPSFSGFRAGVSYTPDSGDNLHVSTISDTSSAQYDNSVDFGVEYKGTFNDVGVHVSGRYMTGEYEGNDNHKQDNESWAVGGQVDYQGFSLAAGYGDNGKSGLTADQRNAGQDAGSWYDVGLAYSTGPYKIAAGYFHAETKISTTAGKDEMDWFGVTGDYTVAPGLSTFAEYDYIQMDAATTATTGSNDANVFMVGTKVSF